MKRLWPKFVRNICMPKHIICSPLSENDYISILNYLQKNWDDKVVQGFIEITTALLAQITNNPKQFPVVYKKEKSGSAF